MFLGPRVAPQALWDSPLQTPSSPLCFSVGRVAPHPLISLFRWILLVRTAPSLCQNVPEGSALRAVELPKPCPPGAGAEAAQPRHTGTDGQRRSLARGSPSPPVRGGLGPEAVTETPQQGQLTRQTHFSDPRAARARFTHGHLLPVPHGGHLPARRPPPRTAATSPHGRHRPGRLGSPLRGHRAPP